MKLILSLEIKETTGAENSLIFITKTGNKIKTPPKVMKDNEANNVWQFVGEKYRLV